MRGIFYELIIEAGIGKVIIDDDDWPIAFNTIIEGPNNKREIIRENNISTLRIRNEDIFYSLLENYITLELEKNRMTHKFYKNQYKNKIKWLMAYLFINATEEDFLNPEELIKRKIDFLKDDTLKDLNNGLNIPLGNSFQNSFLRVQNMVANTSMETPYKVDLSLVKDDKKEVEVKLPSIYYGISNGICYIYSMLTPKEEKKSISQMMYKKKINRMLYKVNEKVEKEQDLIDYENGIGEYPEDNIIDVTHSFVLALEAFLTILQKKNIHTVKVVPYLPIRYLSREIAALNKKDQEKIEELQKRNETIQYNLTNKFIRTVRRVAHQDQNIDIISYPYEFDEFLTLELSPKEKEIENTMLKETVEKIEGSRLK